MSPATELARRFLALAERDLRTFRILAASPDADDAALGFHAQQAIEKCLKSVLIRHGIEFRKTHDLVELLDLIADRGRPPPPHADSLDELNPYAAEFRYGLIEPKGLDRQHIHEMVAAVLAWAVKQVG